MVYRLTYGQPDVESESVVNFRFKNAKHDDFSHLFKDIDFKVDGEYITIKREYFNDGHFFGFGDKVGPLDRKGRKYTFWNTDNFTHHPSSDPLYKSFPFFIFVSDDLRTLYGCFTDFPGWMEIDIDSNNDRTISFKIRGSGFDQYIITGKSVKDIVKQYIKLTGKNIAFPIWAFGYQQSRWSYFNQEEVMDIANNFRNRHIPCDVIYLDIDYMDDYKVFTWSKKNFPTYKKMLSKLHNMGFKVISILDPGVKVEKSYEVYEEGKDKYFLKTPNGSDFEGAVWPGRVRFPDFRNAKVRKWWAKFAKKYLDDGIDGFWNDMNEIAIFATEKDLREAKEILMDAKLEDGINLAGKLGSIGEIGKRGHGDDIIHIDGTPYWKVKNTYGLNMTRSTSEMIQNDFKKRPFLITRSAYCGIQRYGGVWTGDNHSWWEHIRQEIVRINSLSIVGVFYSGFDVGGFGGDVNAELLIRFMQLGVFSPMYRNHSAIGTRRQEPWQFGESVEAILRETINLRYKLLPYTYTQYMLGVLNDTPLTRPVFYDFHKPESLGIEDQFMFGNSLMIAPVDRPNVKKRIVWLPKTAINIFEGKIYKKGWRIVDTPIDYIPVFQLVNTAIPMMDPIEYVNMEKVDKITWTVFSDCKSKIISYLYEDDGVSLEYKKIKFNLKKVTIEKDKITITTENSNYDVRKRLWVFEMVYTDGSRKKLEVEVGNDGEYAIPI
ncbi:MAG: TIM-barrel domain-containing protein [Fervidobacterium sp.]